MKYSEAGVDIDAGNEAVRHIKRLARSTFSKSVLTDIGGFGGLFGFTLNRYKNPVLVSSTDSVGTKLKVAFIMNKHNTVGQDLVNHCVNDILVHGAEPLFFLDYVGVSKLWPEVFGEIVKGLTKACRENGCALIGGETAELPGFYQSGEYDLVGFIVGVVERKKILPKKNIKPGDILIGLPSNGLHTNGYSLARKILFEKCGYEATTYLEALKRTVGEELLRVHRSYLKLVFPLLQRDLLKGLAHITGGSFIDNIPRILPENCSAEIRLKNWIAPPIFKILEREGEIFTEEMFRTFNMGIGMVLIVNENNLTKVLSQIKRQGEKAYLIGQVKRGKRTVELKGSK
ncbi:MAG: phosphoribosylformylglycinamidine cyclo-ligase [Candidatus Edwardsbacteria bacterium]